MPKYSKAAVKAAAQFIIADAEDQPVKELIDAFLKVEKFNPDDPSCSYSTWVRAAQHIGADPYGTIASAKSRAKKVLEKY